MVLDANDGRGMYRHGYILAKELARLGHAVNIAYIDPEDGVSVEDGVTIHRISGVAQKLSFLYAQRNVRHHPPVPDRLVIRKLYKIVQNFKPDVIHVHGWVLYSIALLKKYIDVPIVSTLHDYGYICPTKTLLKKDQVCEQSSHVSCIACGKHHYGLPKSYLTVFGVNKYQNKLAEAVDMFVAVSSYVKTRYAMAGFPNDKIEVMPNFYNPSEIEQCDKESDDLPNDFILYVGEFTRFKGIDVLIKAFKLLKTNIQLVLIGRPNYPGLIEKKILVLVDPPRKVVLSAFHKCKFVVIPSIWADPCPTVAFEAMASKKAVIGSSIGGLEDIIIDKKTGFLVPPNDIEKLKSTMFQLLKNQPDLKSIGDIGYRRLKEHYVSEIVVKKIENLYCNLI